MTRQQDGAGAAGHGVNCGGNNINMSSQNGKIDEKMKKNNKNILFLCTIFSVFEKHHFTIIHSCTITWKSTNIVCNQPTIPTI